MGEIGLGKMIQEKVIFTLAIHLILFLEIEMIVKKKIQVAGERKGSSVQGM